MYTELEETNEALKVMLTSARTQLAAMNLKEARNTCWRVIKQCRDNGGYGHFFSSDRIAIYIEAYEILGDVFYARDDIGQAGECYEKAVLVFEEHLEKTSCSVQTLSIIESCHLKLAELFSNAFIKLKAVYDSRGQLYFAETPGNKIYRFDIHFVGESEKYSAQPIEEISLCACVLQELQDRYVHIYKVETAFKTLQLCEPGSIGTRPKPAPAEFVFVSFAGIEKSVKLQRCYG